MEVHREHDRKRAEEALRQSEARLTDGERDLQMTIDTIPVFVATYRPDGTRTFVNRTWQEYMGLTLEEATGANARTFPHFHPDDAERNDQAWRASLESGEPLSIEVRVRRADGQYRWHISRRVPLRDEKGAIVKWYSVGIDIEDQKVAEEALRLSEARLAETESELRKIINTIPALAWSARADGTAEFFNQHYLDYVGLSLEEVQDWGWTVAVHPDDLDGLAGKWQLIMASGQSGEGEVRLRRHDGEYRWFLFRANPLCDDAGNIIKWYGTNIDIEDRKRADEALRREVTERTRAEQLARIDETRFRRFFDLPLIGMAVTSPERRFLEVNEKLCQILGYPREELIGRDWASITHPDDLSGNLGLLDEAIAGATESYSMDKRYLNRDGQIVYVSISVCCARRTDGTADHFVLTVQDVTARRRAEEALRESEQRFRDYAEAASDWLWETGPDHRFTWFSLRATGVHQPDNRIGRTRWEITAEVDEEPEKWRLHIATLDAHEPFRDFTYRAVQADGSVAYLAVSGKPVFDAQGRFKGYRGVASDVTAAVRADQAEKALHQAQAELAHVARVTSLGALTASIAHEVNQPLAGIITNASTCLRMLANDPPNIDGARETVRRTLRDGNRASEVITRLRTLFSKKDAVMDAVDLNEATREVLAMSLSEFQRGRLVARLELADDLPHVAGDRVQLQQVILNLLINAADAMSDVEDRTRQMLIRTQRDEGDRVRLSVQDAGVGLDPRSMDKLFEAFYTTKSNGMGIGLSVSRSIIERHHGRLWAAPNDGPGATFSFSIPCSPG
jgi:PAS domain S-box-containing protein